VSSVTGEYSDPISAELDSEIEAKRKEIADLLKLKRIHKETQEKIDRKAFNDMVEIERIHKRVKMGATWVQRRSTPVKRRKYDLTLNETIEYDPDEDDFCS
jgi:hypothetical protein